MFDQLQEVLKQGEKSAQYSPLLARFIGGVTATVLLDYILSHQEAGIAPNWLKLSPKQLEEVTGLSAEEQKAARDLLRRRGFLREQWVGQPETPLAVQVDGAELLGKLEKMKLFFPLSGSEQSIPSLLPEQNQTKPENNPVEQTLTQNIKLTQIEAVSSATIDPYFNSRRNYNMIGVSPHYQFAGPWESQEEFEEFQWALLEYFIQKGAENPSGFVFKIIDSITKGLVSPFWEEFKRGEPLGASQKIQRDWEIAPGVPYPAFEEERIQYYLQKKEPLEMAVAKARKELRDPRLAQDLWDGFLRKCDRLADEGLKAQKLGVKTPYLPSAFTEKKAVTKESVMAKLAQLHNQVNLPPSLEQNKAPKNDTSPPPSLESLQKAYENPLGRNIVEQQLQKHPEWGYKILEGQIVDSLPF
ncbi:hypothetical protein K4A83_10060 [Spirulina subsalsa FACHB-351]|uniref:Uncharacterized protein n=1 Tax=Spirulina subsalsa FACHB-351 TaxID=234711 RepID=A0ABT3L524_9CYAN|nr:hypothetical protein [Spirulina subsalsa]MCW6036604.1 hypothetical protein [Spirulina subsalsa FACHB-351]